MTTNLEPGTIFAREYRVERPLRSGGMGAVLVVEHIGTGKLRALKLLATELEDNEEMRERFVREARAASAIESEHVVEIITAGVDEETNRPYIVMELLQGEDLGDRIERRGPLDHATASLVFRQLGHALGAAHRRGIVHRDLKPENVFLAQGRRPGDEICVKLLDFGVAKILPSGGSSQPTQPLGSPLFMSPEQTDADGAIVPSTDVWALGLLAFFLLTGQYFWISAESCSVPALLREVCFDELPPASVRANVFGAKRDCLPEGFDAWFAGCVSREAGGRFPDGETAANALADLLERGTSDAARVTPAVPATLDADWFFDEAPRRSTPTSWSDAAPAPSIPPAEPDVALMPASEEPAPPTEASVAEPPARVSSASPPARISSASPPARISSASPPARRSSASPPVPPDAAPAAAAGEQGKAAATAAAGRTPTERARALRNLLGAVAAGCIGGGICFVAVGGLSFATTEPQASVASASAAPAVRPSSRPAVTAAPRPVVSASAKPPPPAASELAPRAPSPRPFVARPEDVGCPSGMRFVSVDDVRVCLHAAEVTVAQWTECTKANVCPRLGQAVRLAGVRPDAVAAARLACVTEASDGELPVNCVDRTAAAAYCDLVDARLPDEREWLAAARGSRAAPRSHPWGEEPVDVRRANLCDESCVAWAHEVGFLREAAMKGDDGAATLAPVGSYAAGATPELVHDLTGNVAEWTSSDVAEGAIVRGSSFSSATGRDEARVVDPHVPSPEVGFRCAADP